MSICNLLQSGFSKHDLFAVLGFIGGKKPHSAKRDQRDGAGNAWDDARHVAQRVPHPGQL